ncbi:MAG: heavy-metal-associated domain-containing protein [Chitinophagales bacterium]|nr:heavy-metal-associated domain-containing protein [Chitinophagales bacterium]
MELTFKTSLKCSGCEAKVKPFLDEMKQIEKWSADLSVNPKTVTVQGQNLNVQEIIATIEKAGFKAELV